MCLVLLAVDTHPDYALVVAANRDEFYDRPTARAGFWEDAPQVLAGRDLRAGGTWLGIDRGGRLAAVTNYRQGQREPEAARSRGRLVADFLIGRSDAGAHVARVEREAALYNGFNLIAGDGEALYYFSNREGRVRSLGPGVYGLSNHLLDSPWPKVTTGKSGLSALLAGGGDPLPGLFELLSDSGVAADHLLPSTGVSREWERLLSAAFIRSEAYGTRSSTVVLFGRDRRVLFVERSFGPDGAAGEEARYRLDLAEADG
jgi:uncharacterized protein with NRDE domain